MRLRLVSLQVDTATGPEPLFSRAHRKASSFAWPFGAEFSLLRCGQNWNKRIEYWCSP